MRLYDKLAKTFETETRGYGSCREIFYAVTLGLVLGAGVVTTFYYLDKTLPPAPPVESLKESPVNGLERTVGDCKDEF